MSSHYNTEPAPTASVLLHTTAGPIQISLFATQTPRASRNFVQHVLDGYYESTIFHRVVPGFVLQCGDPTGTGEGGESIYEDREFEVDLRTGEKVLFGDELHSRLKFNRRGLVGMAKMGGDLYGSQFFITLADVRAQLDGKCTMFGRVEGEGIYNVVRIAEAENVEGTERPMYPFKITGAEVLEMPKGEPWASMKRRDRAAKRTVPEDGDGRPRKKTKTKKGARALLSFGGEEADEDAGSATQAKAKFNTSLINSAVNQEAVSGIGKTDSRSYKIQSKSREEQFNKTNGGDAEQKRSHEKKLTRKTSSPTLPPHSKRNSTPTSNSPKIHHRKPSFHEQTTQLPLKDPESPSRSQSPSASASPEPPTKSTASNLNAEIAALKASMRRTVPTAAEPTRKKSALERMIPEASIRGRKRPKPGTSNNNDSSSLKILDAFKARLDAADRVQASSLKAKVANSANGTSRSQDPTKPAREDNDDKEATLCDLHFIANCQSCSKWDKNDSRTNSHDPSTQDHPSAAAKEQSTDWMSHALSFEKDRLGKDLTWKRKNEEELVVIDPREKEKEIGGVERGRGKDRQRQGQREWGGRGR